MIVQELVASLGLEVDEQVFSKMEAIFHGLSKGLVGLGAAFGAAVVGMGAMVASTAEAGDEAAKTAEQLGETTQTVQALQYAAVIADSSAEALTAGLGHLARNAYEASKGSEEARASFHAVGVSVVDAHGKLKPASVLLSDIADKFHDLPNGQTKAALAMKVFGRNGRELIPLLNRGAEGIEQLKQRAMELGVVMDDETIAASEEFDDSAKELHASMIGLRNAIGGPLIGAFTKLITGMTKGAVALSTWLKKTQAIEKISDALSWAFKRVYEVLRAIAIALPIAAVAWALLTAAQGAAGSSLIFLIAGYVATGAAAVASAVSAAAAWLLAVAPFILLGAAIVLIADELYNFVTGGETMLGRLIKWFETVDPTDGPFFKALKAAGALLFDISDPAKWTAMWNAGKDAIGALASWIQSKLGTALIWVGEKILSILPAPLRKLLEGGMRSTLQLATGDAAGAAATALGSSADFLTSPFSGRGGAENPAAAVQNSSTANTSSVHDARVFAPQISVMVPPGTDAQGVGNASSDAVRQVYDSELSAAKVATDY